LSSELQAPQGILNFIKIVLLQEMKGSTFEENGAHRDSKQCPPYRSREK
jgi:hypothetical protein